MQCLSELRYFKLLIENSQIIKTKTSRHCLSEYNHVTHIALGQYYMRTKIVINNSTSGYTVQNQYNEFNSLGTGINDESVTKIDSDLNSYK